MKLRYCITACATAAALFVAGIPSAKEESVKEDARKAGRAVGWNSSVRSRARNNSSLLQIRASMRKSAPTLSISRIFNALACDNSVISGKSNIPRPESPMTLGAR